MMTRRRTWLAASLAAAWLASAAPAAAGMADGEIFFDAGKWTRATAELCPLAEDGNPKAQFLVATMLDEGGHGIVPDAAAALDWYHRAAEQDHVSAQYALFLHYSVTPGPDNERQEKAMDWARRLAEAGPTLADHDRLQAAMAAESLGVYHARGLFAPADPPLAYRWYTIAERLGRTEIEPTRAALGDTLEPEARATAEAEAERWWAAHGGT